MLKAPEFEKRVGMEVYLTDTPGLGGKLKESPSDFIVDEISIEPERFDASKYAIARVRSTNWETNKLIRELARALRIGRNEIGFAGTKDKRAVTTQMMSFPTSLENIMSVEIPGVEFLDLYTSKYSVQIGRLIGNRFDIMLRQVRKPVEEMKEIVKEIAAAVLESGGFPNFFGIQRFGAVRPLTHLVGRAIIQRDFRKAVEYYIGFPQKFESEPMQEARAYFTRTGDFEGTFELMPKYYSFERSIIYHMIHNPEDYIGALRELPKNLLMMFTHAYQSYLFNRILSERIRRGLPLNEPVEGDYVLSAGGLGNPDHSRIFPVTPDNLEKVKRRTREFRSFVTGLIYGRYSVYAEGEMGEIERKVVESEDIGAEAFVIPDLPECTSSGMRKEIFSHIDEMDYNVGNGWVRFIFTLYKGSYATTLLREFMKSEDPSSY